MIPFSPADAFPLLPPDSENYAAEKVHSAAVDAWLGLRVAEVEAGLAGNPEGQETWQRAGADVFLTPYTELRAWLEMVQPRPGQLVVDLGAAYGRLGFVLNRHFPGVDFLGLELVPERVKEGAAALARFGAERARLLVADLADSEAPLPLADVYFIYDFGVKSAISGVLERLRKVAASRPITVVGRGRGVRDLIEKQHPWLGDVNAPLHRAHFSVYRS
jgi:hypothetical protein